MFQRRGAPLKEGQPREGFYYRTWTEYENGFGDQDADFWLGEWVNIAQLINHVHPFWSVYICTPKQKSTALFFLYKAVFYVFFCFAAYLKWGEVRRALYRILNSVQSTSH